MFYPKDLISALGKPNIKVRAQIHSIHNTLYKFAKTSLFHLIATSPSFRFIIDYSVKRQEEIFGIKTSDSNKRKKHNTSMDDTMIGLRFLLKLKN